MSSYYSVFFPAWEPLPTFVPAPSDSNIVAHVALVVKYAALNGPDFVQMTKEKRQNDPKFSFLSGGEGSDYYKWSLYCKFANIRSDIPPPVSQPTLPPYHPQGFAAPPPPPSYGPIPPGPSFPYNPTQIHHYNPPQYPIPQLNPPVPGPPSNAAPSPAVQPPRPPNYGASLPMPYPTAPSSLSTQPPLSHLPFHPLPTSASGLPYPSLPAANLAPPPRPLYGLAPVMVPHVASQGDAGFGLPVDLESQFNRLIDSLSGTQDSIRSTQQWVQKQLDLSSLGSAQFAEPLNPGSQSGAVASVMSQTAPGPRPSAEMIGEGIAKILASRCLASVAVMGGMDKALHIMYLCNDVLINSSSMRLHAMDGGGDTSDTPPLTSPAVAALVSKLESTLMAPMVALVLAAAAAAQERMEEVREKLAKMVMLWGNHKIFSRDALERMNYSIATVLFLDQARRQLQQALHHRDPTTAFSSAAGFYPASPMGMAVAAPPPQPPPVSVSVPLGLPHPPSHLFQPTAPLPPAAAAGWMSRPPHGIHAATSGMHYPSPLAPPGLAGAVAPPMGPTSQFLIRPPPPQPQPQPPSSLLAPHVVPVQPLGPPPEPVSSFDFPPGLLPKLVAEKNQAEVPYHPLDPKDIEEEGLPPSPDCDEYLLSRIDRLRVELESYRPGLLRADLEDQSARRLAGKSGKLGEGEGGWAEDERVPRRRRLEIPVSALAAGGGGGGQRIDGSYVGPAGQYAGLGSVPMGGEGRDDEEGEDVFSKYRNQRSTVYHQTMVTTSNMARGGK